MTYKNSRYRHEKLCTDEPKPVKPHTKPKAKVKMMPKPKFQVEEVYEEQVEEEQHSKREALPSGNPKLTQPVLNQVLKPSNPLNDASADASRGSVPDQKGQALRDLTNHYQLLQQQFIQQKK